MQNPEEPDAEPGAECRTPCCQFFGGNADFEVNFLALKEETDGIFLSYTVVQCTPSVCDALAKSRNEFYQASQSHKVVLHWPPPLNRGQGITYCTHDFSKSSFKYQNLKPACLLQTMVGSKCVKTGKQPKRSVYLFSHNYMNFTRVVISFRKKEVSQG